MSQKNEIKRVLVTGGAGYVGAVLVPKLLDQGYAVRVIDLMWFGEDVLPTHERLDVMKADVRDANAVAKAVADCDAVIHLACISNDPSFELDPTLGRSINLDAFEPLVVAARDAGVSRFIYASSSSVYGISDQPNVTEDHALNPLTDYSQFKADCEQILARYQADDFTTFTLRPATVCGVSPRQRLDLTVNILTHHALQRGKITVFGGTQKRPNIHIADVTDLYVQLLREPAERIAGRVFNAGYHNHTVSEIANIVRQVVARDVEIVTTPTDDNRSYHICSDRIARELGFVPQHSIEDAVRDLMQAFENNQITNAETDPRYYNIKVMQNYLTQETAA